MLSKDQCFIIARDECAKMFGLDFVEKHKPEFCATAFVDEETRMYNYSLMWSPIRENKEKGITIGHKPFDYYVSVVVDMDTGEVRKDPDERKTKLPM